MNFIPAKCIEFNEKRRICTALQNGKTYRLNNESGFTIRKVVVDNCLIQGIGERRCDYLMNYEGHNFKRVIFIELKGGALVDALKQIFSTIVLLKEDFKNHQIDARIVGSRDVPGFINTPEYRKLAKEVIPTNGKVERGTNKIYEETV